MAKFSKYDEIQIGWMKIAKQSIFVNVMAKIVDKYSTQF